MKHSETLGLCYSRAKQKEIEASESNKADGEKHQKVVEENILQNRNKKLM